MDLRVALSSPLQLNLRSDDGLGLFADFLAYAASPFLFAG